KLGAPRVLSWDPEALQLPGLAETLAAAGIQLVPSRLGDPDRRQALAALESIPVGLTAAAAGLARTGSIVLHAHRGQGRLASLLPPIHFALLHVSQLYPDIAAWLAAAGTGQRIAEHSNTVIITGPSRSADIAQTLTLGAHGPRRVHVILVG
ncbi:MAG: lactate utilization protein, partial [Caldilineae bacterium]